MHRKLTFAIGLLLFTSAWLLPVHEHGIALPEGLPGWEAFLIALFPAGTKGYLDGVLRIASALTNLLILVVLFARPWRADRLSRILGCALALTLPLNAQWYLNIGPHLRIGYYLWWTSFGILSAGCLLPAVKQQLPNGRPV